MEMDLDFLETLDAVAREGSFAKAAKKLNKVSSAVSYSIRSLEKRLGVTLLDRSQYRTTLTPVGKVVLEEGRKLLSGARRLESMIEHFRQEWEPSLEVVVDGVIPIAPIMKVLKTLSDEGSPTHIQIRMEFLSGVQERFEREHSDLMLVKEFQSRRGMESHLLPEIVCYLVASHQHPLVAADVCRALSLSDLQEHVELLIKDSGRLNEPAHRHRLGSPRNFFLSDFYTKKEALKMGLGFGWMPLEFVQEELESGELVIVPYEGGSSFRFTPSLVYRKEKPLGRTGQRLLTLLMEEFQLLENQSMDWEEGQFAG